MRNRVLTIAALVIAACVALVACSSSGAGTDRSASAGTTTSGPGGGQPVKVGVLADLTGAGSSGFGTTEKGVKAYFDRINASGGIRGQKIEYVMADTTSSPAGALTAVQKLWQDDHVFAILLNSAVSDGVLPFTLKNHIPIIAAAVSGTGWSDPQYTNAFVASGIVNPDYMMLAQGEYMKSQGATRCGSVSANTTNGQKAATAFVKSCEAVGLKTAYLNTQMPLGSTDVGPIALAMKHARVDGLTVALAPSSSFALIAALHQLGVKMKSILLSTGYGGDLLASKASIEAAQGVDFSTMGAPAEANTPATKQRAADLAKLGITGPPSFAVQGGYLAASAFVAGLKAAGPHPSREAFIKAMDAIKDFDADGLLAPEKVDFHDYAPATKCLWVARLTGNKFQVVHGTPVCAPTKKIS